MACLESVIFGLLGKSIRVQRLYDRSRLRLGSLVYVRPSAQEDGTEFSPEWSDGSIPYWVRWIATSEWYVELIPRFELRAEFAERVHKEVEGYLSRTEVNDAIAKFVGLVRMERFYQTSELGGNPLSVVFTVIDRLEVCRRLRQSPPFPVEFFKTALDDPLVTYLYLTCFDRLGQPADWLDFGAWMESSRHKAERDAILQQVQSQGLEDGIRFVHREYNSLYGVRSSFSRFLHGLPADLLDLLLAEIVVQIAQQVDA
jgi:hypothetical protein